MSVTRIADSPPAVRGYVYFFHSPRTGLTKIGQSCDPNRRLVQIRTDVPDLMRIRVLKTNNPRELESYFHTCFAHRQVYRRREWFALTPEDLKIIAACPHHPRVGGLFLGPDLHITMPRPLIELHAANWSRRR